MTGRQKSIIVLLIFVLVLLSLGFYFWNTVPLFNESFGNSSKIKKFKDLSETEKKEFLKSLTPQTSSSTSSKNETEQKAVEKLIENLTAPNKQEKVEQSSVKGNNVVIKGNDVVTNESYEAVLQSLTAPQK